MAVIDVGVDASQIDWTTTEHSETLYRKILAPPMPNEALKLYRHVLRSIKQLPRCAAAQSRTSCRVGSH